MALLANVRSFDLKWQSGRLAEVTAASCRACPLPRTLLCAHSHAAPHVHRSSSEHRRRGRLRP
eukprot:scaffold162568_cov33-Tisochrysis_lutea.AAC.2